MIQFDAEKSKRAGTWLIQQGPEPFAYFFPAPLPPVPSVRFDLLHEYIEKANRALGRLDGITVLLPDPGLFLYQYIRKEAVLSSQIEGTQSSLSDLLLFENEAAPGVPLDDVREVSNYVSALNYGLERLAALPLSLRLFKEIHAKLLEGTRGSDKTPGEFRTSQNWVGGTRPGNARYVPPPPYQVLSAMGDLEKFLHNDPASTPTLIKAGLAHAQFESIHPFLDGNGRLGRLLITFVLCAEGALSQPLLYLSLYFKQHRDEYYNSLQRVRTEGDWESWLLFYLQGVEEVSLQACDTAKKLVAMFAGHRQKIQSLKRAGLVPLCIHEVLQKRPIVSPSMVAKETGISFPAVNGALLKLEKLGLVREITGRQRNRLFVYEPYFKIISEGTEIKPVQASSEGTGANRP